MSHYTLGQLLRDLEFSEHAYGANMRAAERTRQELGELAARYDEVQAGALTWRAIPQEMPGIERIELLCNEQFGTEITAEGIRRLRAELCRKAGIDINTANEYALTKAADAIERGAKPNGAGRKEDKGEFRRSQETPQPKRKPGRKRKNESLDDAVAKAWDSGNYKDAKAISEECDTVRGLLTDEGLPVQAVQKAMIRIRSARARAKKRVRNRK